MWGQLGEDKDFSVGLSVIVHKVWLVLALNEGWMQSKIESD